MTMRRLIFILALLLATSLDVAAQGFPWRFPRIYLRDSLSLSTLANSRLRTRLIPSGSIVAADLSTDLYNLIVTGGGGSITNNADGISITTGVDSSLSISTGFINTLAMRVVSPNFTSASGVMYKTLQAALAAVSDGDVILVGPGEYAVSSEIAISKKNVSLIGSGPPSRDSTTGALKLGGTNITFTSGSARFYVTGRGCIFKNIGMQRGDPANHGDCFTSYSASDLIVDGCVAIGSTYNAAYHDFLFDGGSGLTLTRCKAYNNTHGFAILMSDVNASDLYAENNYSDGLIIKSKYAGKTIKNVNVVNFSSRDPSVLPIYGTNNGIVLDARDSAWLSSVHLTNIYVYGANVGGVYMKTDGGTKQGWISDVSVNGGTILWSLQNGFWITGDSIKDIKVSNLEVGLSYNDAFRIDTCANVTISNCIANYTTYGYGYNVRAASNVIVSSSFAISCAAGANSGTFADWQINNAHGPIIASTIDLVGDAYLRGDVGFLNKAGTGWMWGITRYMAGSGSAISLDSVHSITFDNGVVMDGTWAPAGLSWEAIADTITARTVAINSASGYPLRDSSGTVVNMIRFDPPIGLDSSVISTTYKVMLGRTSRAITIDSLCYQAIGGTTPNVTARIAYGMDFSAAGTRVDSTTVTSNTTATMQAGAQINTASIPAGQSYWLTFEAVGKKPENFFVSVMWHYQ